MSNRWPLHSCVADKSTNHFKSEDVLTTIERGMNGKPLGGASRVPHEHPMTMGDMFNMSGGSHALFTSVETCVRVYVRVEYIANSCAAGCQVGTCL